MKIKHNKYESYKDSGVEWLGEIPEEWEFKKLKYLGNIYAGLNGKKGDDFSKEEKLGMKPFVPFTNIYNNLIIDENQLQYVKIADTEVQNKVCNEDLLFLMSSETMEDIGKCSIYFGNNKTLYLNSFCKGFRISSNEVKPKYANYLIISESYRRYFQIYGRGFTRMNLKQEYIENIEALLPSIQEQTEIANFLDNKTTKIDSAIAQKEKMIELLKERKQIIIQNAVTGKINCQNQDLQDDGMNRITKDENKENPEIQKSSKSRFRQMKDSGIEWIGEIPEGWEVEPIKHSLKGVIDCEHKTAPFIDEKDYFVVRTSNVKDGKLTFENAKYTHYKGFIEWTERGIPAAGDILLTREAPAGEACLVPDNVKLCLGQRMVWLKVDKSRLIPQLGLYFIYSSVGRTYIDFLSSGSTVLHFNMADIKNIPIISIPIEEQGKIVTYIETQSAKIDKAIALQQTQIEKLKEYKATLIDSAVTGKIKII